MVFAQVVIYMNIITKNVYNQSARTSKILFENLANKRFKYFATKTNCLANNQHFKNVKFTYLQLRNINVICNCL